MVFREVAVAGLGRPGAAALTDAAWAERIRPAPEPGLPVKGTAGLLVEAI